MRGQRLHRAPVCRDAAAGVERAEPNQQVARAGERRRWRRIEPAQLLDRRSPGREIERERLKSATAISGAAYAAKLRSALSLQSR